MGFFVEFDVGQIKLLERGKSNVRRVGNVPCQVEIGPVSTHEDRAIRFQMVAGRDHCGGQVQMRVLPALDFQPIRMATTLRRKGAVDGRTPHDKIDPHTFAVLGPPY